MARVHRDGLLAFFALFIGVLVMWAASAQRLLYCGRAPRAVVRAGDVGRGLGLEHGGILVLGDISGC